jgi:Ser/Thr protein kinase RdoA (MazF antagonist)
MFSFIEGSHTIDVVETPEQAYEAAAQFGRFTRILSDLDVGKLKITIPDFHALSLRYKQFLSAIENGNADRKKESAPLIKKLLAHSSIVEEYEKIRADKNFITRVTHHDTKISNVLFDENDKGICVIDLDTVMPGYFFSDVGDMMRTYLSPVSEEEKDFTKIDIREDIYRAIVNGYYREMNMVLTETEQKYFFYSGCFMIYMQALRFLTDFLNNDIYYGQKYPGHNMVRAGNQAILLQRLMDKKHKLSLSK